jgi:hypothetical protein
MLHVHKHEATIKEQYCILTFSDYFVTTDFAAIRDGGWLVAFEFHNMLSNPNACAHPLMLLNRACIRTTQKPSASPLATFGIRERYGPRNSAY